MGVVDAVPDAPSTCDLVLPLLELRPPNISGAKFTHQWVLPRGVRAVARIPRQCVEGVPRGTRRNSAEVVPSRSRVARGEPQLPFTSSGWRGHQLSALGHVSSGPPDPGADLLDRSAQTTCRPVSVQSRGGSPVLDEAAQGSELTQVGASLKVRHELRQECTAVCLREESCPGKARLEIVVAYPTLGGGGPRQEPHGRHERLMLGVIARLTREAEGLAVAPAEED